MNETEIVSLIHSALPVVQNVVTAIGGAIITTIFLRNNTSTKEFEKLKAGKLQEVADDLLESGKMTYSEYYKARNFLSIVKKADEEYSKSHHDNTTAVYDFDWLMRLYEAVGNISDEKMQLVWAKILAGEVNNPKSFSLRTLDVVRNLNKQEAELFEKICKHSIRFQRQHRFLPNYENYLSKCGISYSEILHLDEIGLLNSNGLLVFTGSIDNNHPPLIFNQDLVMIITAKTEDTKKYSINQFPFTCIGYEMATLIGDSTSNEDFMLFAQGVAKEQSINISVHKINNITDTEITYDDTDLMG